MKYVNKKTTKPKTTVSKLLKLTRKKLKLKDNFKNLDNIKRISTVNTE